MLATASREDLLAVKNHEFYWNQTEDFGNAIEQAFSSAKPGKVRLGVTGPKVEAVKRIFRDDIKCILLPEAVVGIIGSYTTEDYENDKTERRSDSGEEIAPDGTSKRMPAEQEARQPPEIDQGQEREQARGRRHSRRRTQELENVTRAQEVQQMPQEVEQVTTRTEEPERVAEEPARKSTSARSGGRVDTGTRTKNSTTTTASGTRDNDNQPYHNQPCHNHKWQNEEVEREGKGGRRPGRSQGRRQVQRKGSK